MKANLHAIDGDRFGIIERLDDRFIEAVAHDSGARGVCQIAFAAIMGMVAMRVRDECPLDRLPGIQIKIAGCAVQSF